MKHYKTSDNMCCMGELSEAASLKFYVDILRGKSTFLLKIFTETLFSFIIFITVTWKKLILFNLLSLLDD